MEEAYRLVSLGTHYGSTLGNHAEKGVERRGAAEGSGLLRFNDCLWMIGTNKQPFCICALSVSSLAAD